jgi:hypothetical protein
MCESESYISGLRYLGGAGGEKRRK